MQRSGRFFYITALESLTDDRLTVEELIRMTMRTGEAAIEVMKVLDEANTSVYGNPSPHTVNVHIRKGPFIIVSGHDLKDLEMLLRQTEGTGINIYTHGEMLPSHGYEGLKNIPISLEILVEHGRISRSSLMESPAVF